MDPRKDPAPPRRVPSLFVEDGEKRTAIIAPDAPAARDPQEVLRTREKRRRQQESERLVREAEAMASFRRIRNTVVAFVAVGLLAWGFWWFNQKYQGNWPVFVTWSVIAFVMLAGFGWALWYTEKV